MALSVGREKSVSAYVSGTAPLPMTRARVQSSFKLLGL